MLYCTFGFKEKKLLYSNLTLYCMKKNMINLLWQPFYMILTGFYGDYCIIDDIWIQFSCQFSPA